MEINKATGASFPQFLLILFSFCFNTATKHLQVFERLHLMVSKMHSMGRKWIANQWRYKYLWQSSLGILC